MRRLAPIRLEEGPVRYSNPEVLLPTPRLVVSGSNRVYFGILGALYQRFCPDKVKEMAPNGVFFNTVDGSE